jgi:hypothetical protein
VSPVADEDYNRLVMKARNLALTKLKDAHRAEYEVLYTEAREKLGVPRKNHARGAPTPPLDAARYWVLSRNQLDAGKWARQYGMDMRNGRVRYVARVGELRDDTLGPDECLVLLEGWRLRLDQRAQVRAETVLARFVEEESWDAVVRHQRVLVGGRR